MTPCTEEGESILILITRRHPNETPDSTRDSGDYEDSEIVTLYPPIDRPSIVPTLNLGPTHYRHMTEEVTERVRKERVQENRINHRKILPYFLT